MGQKRVSYYHRLGVKFTWTIQEIFGKLFLYSKIQESLVNYFLISPSISYVRGVQSSEIVACCHICWAPLIATLGCLWYTGGSLDVSELHPLSVPQNS